MAGYRYSLAHVQVALTLEVKDENGNAENVTKTFGGQGSMIGSITVSRKNERFSAEGDPTGGFVINETLDKTGTCVISIKQFAPLVSTLTNLFNSYDNNYLNQVDSNGEAVINITPNLTGEDTLRDSASIGVYYMGRLIAECKGTYLNVPELTLEEENGSRDFSFECGQVDYELLDNTQTFATRI